MSFDYNNHQASPNSPSSLAHPPESQQQQQQQQQQLPQPSSSNSFLQLRFRPNATTPTITSNRHDDKNGISQRQAQLNATRTDTISFKTLSYPHTAQTQASPPVSDSEHSAETSHSPTIKKVSSNPNVVSPVEEDQVECRHSSIDETTCSELPSTKTNQLAENHQDVEEEPLCRICLGGRDDDDPTLGRFIQPCLCRGTMAFIHVGCLQRWRITSPSLKSFYRCDQCGYRYKLRRAKIAGLAQNKVILGSVTFMIFFILVIVSGFIASWLLESYSQITSIDANWDDGLSPFSYDSTGKIVGEVVGEAVRVLNSKLHVDTSTPGGRTPVSRFKFTSQAQSEKQFSKLKAIQTEEDEGHSYRYVRAKAEKNSQDQSVAAHSTRSHKQTSSDTREYSSSMANQEEEQSTGDEERAKPNSNTDHIFQSILSGIFLKLEALIKHTIKGLAFIGVMSFFQLAMSVTLFSPWNFGIRNSVLRMMRSGTAGTRTPGGRPGDPNGLGSLLVLLFVLLGVLKAIQSVWKFVRKSSQWALRKIEDGVLDVRSS